MSLIFEWPLFKVVMFVIQKISWSSSVKYPNLQWGVGGEGEEEKMKVFYTDTKAARKFTKRSCTYGDMEIMYSYRGKCETALTEKPYKVIQFISKDLLFCEHAAHSKKETHAICEI